MCYLKGFWWGLGAALEELEKDEGSDNVVGHVAVVPCVHRERVDQLTSYAVSYTDRCWEGREGNSRRRTWRRWVCQSQRASSPESASATGPRQTVLHCGHVHSATRAVVAYIQHSCCIYILESSLLAVHLPFCRFSFSHPLFPQLVSSLATQLPSSQSMRRRHC